MIAYIFDGNGYFVGVSSAQENPKKVGEYLKPSNGTFIAPPDSGSYPSDKEPLFNEDLEQWELVDSRQKIETDEQLLELKNQYGVNLYKTDNNGNVVPKDTAEVDAEVDAIGSDYKLEDARALMDSNILNKAMDITKGTNLPSVQSFLQAYQLRANNPANYVSAGLKVYYAKDTFNIGDNLDTEQKIKDYYNAILIEMDLYRESEIANYLATKASLGY